MSSLCDSQFAQLSILYHHYTHENIRTLLYFGYSVRQNCNKWDTKSSCCTTAAFYRHILCYAQTAHASTLIL